MKKRIFATALSLALMASLAAPAAALDVADARELLEQYYVDELPDAALRAETLEDLLRALNDPYTVYYTAQEYEDFLTSIDGEQLVGIGVSIQKSFRDGFELMSILPNSPALEAGLIPGDKLIAVDGHTLTENDSPASLIAGEEGTPVTITVRSTDGTVRDVTMVRRKVQIPIVTFKQDGSAGFIICDSFGQSTTETIRQAVTELDQNTAVWVMDLRNNPGGTSTSAAGSAGVFLGEKVMVYFRDGSGDYYQTATTRLSADATDKPLIILTSSQSASASELFSAAIRDHRGGITIGQRTYGKGIAQKIFDAKKYPELFDEDGLKITVYRFFSPDGATNHLLGVIPTLLVDPQYTQSIAMLLSSPKPERTLNKWKLELCGHAFYLDKAQCLTQPESLTALLEALPRSAKLYRGTGVGSWIEATPADAAEEFSLSEYSPRVFSDVTGHPYADQINTLRTYNLVSGEEDGLFHPESELTRAQLAVMLAAALNLSAADADAPVFSDVPTDAWYANAVYAMAARGFMSGTGNGAFSPDRTLTNQELCTVYSAVAAWASMDGYKWAGKSISAEQWLEFYDLPEWAQRPIRNLRELGLDVDTENPTAVVTRGEAAGLLCTLLENIHVLWNQ